MLGHDSWGNNDLPYHDGGLTGFVEKWSKKP